MFYLMKSSQMNNAVCWSIITIYLAMTHYWSILWPQIPPLVFHPYHQKAFHLSCYRMWPRQRSPLSCLRWAKRVHSLLSIQIHPEALSGKTKINFKFCRYTKSWGVQENEFNFIDYLWLSQKHKLTWKSKNSSSAAFMILQICKTEWRESRSHAHWEGALLAD